MNTRKSILLLFVLTLLTSGAWAQIHTGLDICLRDEKTGEWLISLFDTCAVYDCDVWAYERAAKGRYTLRLGDRRVEVRLRKGGIDIDRRRHKTTELTTWTLPDYPAGDATAFRDNGYTGGEATVRGWVIGWPSENDLRFVGSDLLTTVGQNFTPVVPDKSGRFEVKIPLANTSDMLLAPVEMWAQPSGGTNVDMALYEKRTDDDLLRYATARLDSAERTTASTLREHPSLSERYRLWRRAFERTGWGGTLVQRYFSRDDVRQVHDRSLWNTLRDSVLLDLPRPYTVAQLSLPYFLNIYARGLTERVNVGYKFDVITEAIDSIEAHAREGRPLCSEALLDTLRTLRRATLDYEAQSRQAQGRTPENHPFERLINQPEVKDVLMGVVMQEVNPSRTAREIASVDTLPLPPDLLDLYRAQLFGNELWTNRTPLPDALQRAVHRSVRSPFYRDRLLATSQQYADLIRQSLERDQASLMSNEPLAGLTDGQEILRRILEPLKGAPARPTSSV